MLTAWSKNDAMWMNKKIMFGLLLKMSFIYLLILSTNELSAQTIKVSGVVKTATNGLPFEGVTITVNKSLQKTLTDTNGTFTISLPKKRGILNFYYIGFNSVTI